MPDVIPAVTPATPVVAPGAVPSAPANISSVRLRPDVGGPNGLFDTLGLLQDLPGTWFGSGFNLIWRPNFAPINGVSSDRFLELNLTQEITKFSFIGSAIPNRGLAQEDITLFGIHYLQQISDAITQGALHIEPGIWVNIPASTQPAVSAPENGNVVARLSTIPHGSALVAQGNATTFLGRPTFEPVNVTPFPIGGGGLIDLPELHLDQPSAFRTSTLPSDKALPEGLTFQQIVSNPHTLLENGVSKSTVLNTTMLQVATSATIPGPNGAPVTTANGVGGIENIAFLSSKFGTPPAQTLPNADVAEMFATFWIEEIDNGTGISSFQLQYSQTVYLNFAGLTWPHVSVATLLRSSVV